MIKVSTIETLAPYTDGGLPVLLGSLETPSLRDLYTEIFTGHCANTGDMGEDLAKIVPRDQLIEDILFGLNYEVDEGTEGEIRAAKDLST